MSLSMDTLMESRESWEHMLIRRIWSHVTQSVNDVCREGGEPTEEEVETLH